MDPCSCKVVEGAAKEKKTEVLQYCIMSTIRKELHGFLFLCIYVIYLFIYYNSQRFPITVNVHVKD